MAEYDGSIRINSGIETKNLRKDEKELLKIVEKLRDAQNKFLESGGSKESSVYQNYAKDIEIVEKKLNSLRIAEGKTASSNEHFNQLKVDLEEYSQAIKDLESQGKYFGDEDFDKVYIAWKNARDAVKEYQTELNKTSAEGQAKEAERAAREAERKAAAQQRAEEQAEKALQKENARIQKEIENEAKLQTKEAERQAKIKAEAAEEERLLHIRENAVVNNQHIVDVLERRKQLIQEISDMEKAGLGAGYQQYDSAKQELAKLNREIKNYSNSTEEMKSSYVRLGDSVRNAFGMIGKGLIDIPIAVVKKGATGLISIFSRLGNTIKNSVAGSFKYLGIAAKNAFSKITKHANKSSGSLSNFAGRVKNLVVSFLVFNQIKKLFSSTISAIKEGFTNLYEENARFKSSVDSLKASILTLKNALASAFAPIVETAIPYIQRLVEWITKAADAMGQLMAALLARKTYTKAVKQSAKASEDATKATKKEADATEEAEKAAEGYLSPLDEINKYNEDKTDTSKASNDIDIPTDEIADGIGNMFEEIPISDRFKDIAQWLKDMWENADFTELGTLLGQKLKDALDNIPWDAIKETARKIGKSIATFINGFVEVEGLGESIGRTLAEAINTGFEFLNAFVHNLHWESIGKFIAETINGFFQNIDWDLIYDTFVTGAKGLGDAINSFVDNLDWNAISTSISNFVNTLVDTIYTFITTTDWKKLGTNLGKTISDAWTGINWSNVGKTIGEAFKSFFDFISSAIEAVDWWAVGESVKNFLVGIDWAGVAQSFFEAVGAAIGGLAAFLGGLIADGVEAARNYFQGKIEEAGGNIVLGILTGIKDAIVGIAEWIVQNIFTPFIEGFKAAFGIHSPSAVMQEMGVMIIQGLLNGINSLVETVKATWESMKQTAINAWIIAKETIVNIWQTIKQTAEDIFNSVKQFFVDTWQNISTNLQNAWSNLKENAINVFTSIKDFLCETWSIVKEKAFQIWSEIKENISNAIENVKEKITNAVNYAKDTWSNGWNSMKEKVMSIIETIKNAIQSAFDWITEKVDSIAEKLSSVGSKAKSIFSKGSSFTSSLFGKSTKYTTISTSPVVAALSDVEIPAYATGQVIPRTMKQHLAILGDNTKETEVVSPLSTIEKAVENALGRNAGSNQPIILKLYLDSKQVLEAIVKEGKVQQMSTGSNIFMLGET